MEFKEIVMSRYATKKFDGKKVPEETFKELLELIRFSASSFNIQPWKILVITDSELKKKLKPASWDQAQIDTCSHLLVFCADNRLDHLADQLDALLKANGTPDESREAYMGYVRGAFKGRSKEDALVYAQKQCYIALGNALNGAKSLGLDSCPMEGFDKNKYSEILELPEHLTPTVLCPVGYAADEPQKKVRFDTEDVFEFRK